MSSNDPQDPNAPKAPAADPEAALAAAEAALAQARAAAQAAAAARAIAEQNAAPAKAAAAGKPAKNAPAKPAAKPLAPVDPLQVFSATGGEERPLIDARGRMRMSRTAIAVAAVVLLVLGGLFVYVISNDEAKARMDAAFAGNTCGPTRKQSCLTLKVMGPRRAQEAEWLEEDKRAKPLYGTVSFTYEPNDATVEIFQVRYRIGPDEWKAKTKELGTKVCEKGADGKEICEFPYKAIENETAGMCAAGKQPTEIPPLTGRPLISLDNFFVPIFETKVDCQTGNVTEAYNYEYRVVFSHKLFDSKSFYITKSAWTSGLGSSTLELPTIALVPKPETMLDELVKFRSELFCYMKRKKLEPDKVPASVVDALRTQNGFVTIELYDRTEALLTTPEHKPWWDERLKEIEAQKCEE